jgi:hypothetical protein
VEDRLEASAIASAGVVDDAFILYIQIVAAAAAAADEDEDEE